MIESPISNFHFQQFDFSSILAYKRDGFVGRQWFFMELEKIFETERGTAGVLITGDPGSGKSALVSQLICSPYSSLQIHQNIIGFHFCEYSEKGKRDGARFVRNLVDQIAARLPGYSDIIVKNELIRRELQGILCEQDITGCFVTSILGPLRELQPQNGLRYIVIDALDECFETDKTSEIIEILSSKILHFPKWLKVILTTRNLTMVTQELPQVVRRKPLYANDDRNVEDIRYYVSRFVSQNSFFVDRLSTAMNFRSRTYDMKIFLDEVIRQAEGNFLFVKMTLQYINDTDGMVNVRSLPTNLFDLYNRFFKRQFGKDGFGPFRYLFEILISVCSPLQLNDVEEILKSEYKEGDILKLIEQASCFLRFGHDGTVRIYHQSFAEWLINQSAVIRINKTRAHQNIANFQLHRIRDRGMNVTFGEVIELFMHILAGNKPEMFANIDIFNIAKMREPQTNQSILHHLAMKPRPFLPVLEFLLPKFKSVDILDASQKTPAFYAASEGYAENLQRLIKRGADVISFLKGTEEVDFFMNAFNIVNNIEKFSLIHAAAAKGHKDVVELLINNNVSFDDSSKKYPTPLHLAAGNGYLKILRLLYDYGAKFDVITLHHAAARNHTEVVEFLLRTVGIRDSCLQCVCKPEDLSKFSIHDVHMYFCETALHAAVSRGYTDVVKMLLAFGNDSMECTHYSGKTVLMDAAERNDTEMVDILLENGANVTTQCGGKLSKRSRSGMCSLYSLAEQDFLYTVYCTEYNCKCGNTAIHVSAKYGFWKVAEKLASKTVFVLTREHNCYGENAVAVAISHGHEHFVYNINETFKNHNRILVDSVIVWGAVSRISEKAVKHILNYPINYIYEHRWELLLHAINWMPNRLFEGSWRPKFCSEDHDGEDLSLAECILTVSRKRLAIVKYLIESYENKTYILNEKDGGGRTLLFHAIEHGFEDVVKYLVEAGASTQVKDRNGENPLKMPFKLENVASTNHNASYRCYTTSDGEFGSCNTSSYDEIFRYLIWWERANIAKCDGRSESLLNTVIVKQLPLSLYELLKAGVDMNCTRDRSITRPFLQHLRIGGRQMSEVFQIFDVDISLKCETFLDSSELHLISCLALPDDLGSFFKPLNKDRSPLQKLIENHPDGVSILNKCYDTDGYLPIHRAVQCGNFAAIKWFKSIGANTQIRTKRGLSALDLSILYLGDISQADLISSVARSPFYWEGNEYALTALNYRSEVFEELLLTFLNTTPQYRYRFPCGSSLRGLSPLHIAAVKGMNVLKYVHKKISEIYPNVPLNCINEHRLDPVYIAHFYESVLSEGLIDKYSDDKGSDDSIEGPETVKIANNRPNNNKSGNYMPSYQYPDREFEYYIAYSYLHYQPGFKFMDYSLHLHVPKDIRISDCPGYHMNYPSMEKNVPDVDFSECSKIQVCKNYYSLLCRDEISQRHARRYACPKMVGMLKEWFAGRLRHNRQITHFIAKRIDWDVIPEVKKVKNRWPIFFLHNVALNKYESFEYLKILNDALEVVDVRFYIHVIKFTLK